AVRHQVAGAAVGVGGALGERHPALVGGAHLEPDRDPGGRPAGGGVEHVGGDAAHRRPPSIWSSLRLVIFHCSPAAFPISIAGSLPRRSLSRASMSSALLPVANTMKM